MSTENTKIHTIANVEDGTASEIWATPRGYCVHLVDTDAGEIVGIGSRIFPPTMKAEAMAYAKTIAG